MDGEALHIDGEQRPRPADQAAYLAALREAQTGWKKAGLDARIGVLQQWKQELVSARDDIVAALSTDTGRRSMAAGELDGLVRSIDRWCELAPTLVGDEERPSKTMPDVGLRQQLEPYPLLGVISPWNFPLLLSFIDAVPALLAGCSVIIKPSEVTPRFAEPVGATVEQPGSRAPFARHAGRRTTR